MIARYVTLSAALTAFALPACASSEAPPAGAGTTRLQLDAFEAAPGEEGLRCQTFAHPAPEDVDIVGWKAIQGAIGHHMLAWVVDDAVGSPLEKCTGEGDAAPIFQSQQIGAAALTYPEGIAAHLGPRQGLRVQIHFLNAGVDAVNVSNAIELTTAAATGQRRHVQPLRYEKLDLRVPRGAGRTTVTRTCKLPRDVDLVMLTGHMHAHGLAIEAKTSALELYASRETVEHPMNVFPSPMPLAQGTEIALSCTYEGSRERDLVFGDSLERDEMCVLVGSYVTRDGTEPGPIACEQPAAPGACLPCFQALVQRAPEKACTDDGAPSSADALAALTACTCGADRCGAACGDSACNGGRPSEGCSDCLAATCASQRNACSGASDVP